MPQLAQQHLPVFGLPRRVALPSDRELELTYRLTPTERGAFSFDGCDLRLAGCILRKNGRIVHTGAGGAVLGSPISSLVWLANALGGLGTVLETGSLVMAGAMTAAVPAAPGDVVTAEIAGLGSVTARFAGA